MAVGIITYTAAGARNYLVCNFASKPPTNAHPRFLQPKLYTTTPFIPRASTTTAPLWNSIGRLMQRREDRGCANRRTRCPLACLFGLRCLPPTSLAQRSQDRLFVLTHRSLMERNQRVWTQPRRYCHPLASAALSCRLAADPVGSLPLRSLPMDLSGRNAWLQ